MFFNLAPGLKAQFTLGFFMGSLLKLILFNANICKLKEGYCRTELLAWCNMNEKQIEGLDRNEVYSKNMSLETEPAYSVSASTVRPLIEYLHDKGMSHAEIKAQHEGAMLCLAESDARVSVNEYHALWKTTIAFSKNEALGLNLALTQNCLEMGIVGHVVFNSDTMRLGLENYIRLFRIVNDSLLLYLDEDFNHGHLVFRHQSIKHYCIPDIERSFVISAKRCQYWLGVQQPFVGVYFQHKPPSYAEQYRKVFKCPVYFNQPDSKIVFDRKALDLPPKHHNPSLKEATLQYANQLPDELRQTKLSEQIRRMIERSLNHKESDIQSIAQKLNMSKEALYKRLKMEGQVFQKLLDNVRLNKACQLLTYSSISPTEIAYILGFSELSAFSRAFKRWTGVSPRVYRANGLSY